MAAGGTRHCARPWCENGCAFAASTGTNLVIGLGDELILKIFPPMLRDQFVSERVSLAQLRGRIECPEFRKSWFEGERDGWPYLVITRLQGILGSGSVAGACRKIRRSGVLHPDRRDPIAEVQRAPLGELSRIEPGWQAVHCKARSRDAVRGTRVSACRKSFSTGWMTFLRDAATLISLDEPPVILTGEYIPENFLFEPRWQQMGPDGADRFWRRDDRFWRIRFARSERLHDRGHEAAGAQSVRGVRIFGPMSRRT